MFAFTIHAADRTISYQPGKGQTFETLADAREAAAPGNEVPTWEIRYWQCVRRNARTGTGRGWSSVWRWERVA